MRIRKNWRSLAQEEKKDYIDAVQCLMKTDSMLSRYAYPSATNRFFDLAAVHIEQIKNTTFNGFHHTWNRHFLWLYENQLRDTCGFKGALPYWDLPAGVDNLRKDPILDGSEYSLSGDGNFTNNNPIVLSPNLQIPHGSGGGCVMSGPFVRCEHPSVGPADCHKANLTTTTVPPSNQFLINGSTLPYFIHEYNPNCLRRDLNTYVAQTWCNFTAVQVAAEARDFTAFNNYHFGVIGGGSLGLLSGGFFTLGGSSSPLGTAQDPIWWSLMAWHDRTYSSWQTRHPDIADSVHGTMTAMNLPPSSNVTLGTALPGWGVLESNTYTIGDLINTTAGPFCYKYDVMV